MDASVYSRVLALKTSFAGLLYLAGTNNDRHCEPDEGAYVRTLKRCLLVTNK